MTYIPHTNAEREEMLARIGCSSMADLFDGIPAPLRAADIDLPGPLSELETERVLNKLANRNFPIDPEVCFLGAGAYNHYIPPIVDDVLRRGEFYTSYTPYQPELSQGMLQAMFEYQTMICRLTGMEVSNASHYDGATSLAETLSLALDVTAKERDEVIVYSGLNPRYVNVLQTYMRGTGASLINHRPSFSAEHDTLSQLGDKTAAVIVQSPDFFGQVQDLSEVADKVHAAGALLIVVTDPIALGIFKPPGDYGADVVVAEGQPLGIPVSFGGPHLGIFATRQKFVRRMSGRLVGETVDSHGDRGYVLTLSTREQHIRRARATSNICTNSALTTLAAAVYLAAMGKHGLKRVAELSYHNSHYAASRIETVAGLAVNPHAPQAIFFREFVVELTRPAKQVIKALRDQHGIVGGHDLGQISNELENHLLVAVTEMNTRSSIDQFADALKQVA